MRWLAFVAAVGFLAGVGGASCGLALRAAFVRAPGVTEVEHYR